MALTTSPTFFLRGITFGLGAKPTLDPQHRTVNLASAPGSDLDIYQHNPWRAPGSAPVYDACGRASGGPHTTGGHGEFTNTTFAKIGDLGSQLPQLPTGVVWKVGSVVETLWSLRSNHGGGYQYRLAPLGSDLSEAVRRATAPPAALARPRV